MIVHLRRNSKRRTKPLTPSCDKWSKTNRKPRRRRLKVRRFRSATLYRIYQEKKYIPHFKLLKELLKLLYLYIEIISQTDLMQHFIYLLKPLYYIVYVELKILNNSDNVDHTYV